MKEIDDLKLLLKAAEDEDEEQPSLFDADEEEEEDEDEEKKEMRKDAKKMKKRGNEDDDEYDAKYIKRYLKKYAQENDNDFKKFCKEIGVLKKAVEEAANVDTDEADAVLVDGTSMFKAFSDFAEIVSESLVEMNGKVNEILKIASAQAAVVKAQSDVLINAAEMLEEGTPMYKGIVSAPDGRRENKLDINRVKHLLYKAAQNGDQRAFNAMTKVESCYGNLNLLGAETIKYISTLAEAK